tara:strand:+ start:562 stop:729 length:168 start_codon:yes stop_codon:yes gene_type:complete
MKITIFWLDEWKKWQRYGVATNLRSAYISAESRAKATGRRFKLSDENGLVDLIDP